MIRVTVNNKHNSTMQTQSKHTPLPWRLEMGGEIYGPSIFIGGDECKMRIAAIGAGGLYRNNMQAEVNEANANAKIIVLAVNSHAAMLAALQDCLQQIDCIWGLLGPDKQRFCRPTTIRCQDQARAAIAGAEKRVSL